MDIYTPPEKIQRNIELVLADYDPTEFYKYLDTLNYSHIERVEEFGGEDAKNHFKGLFDFLPLDSDSDDGIPFIEVIDRVYLLPEDNDNPILSGLKEFYTKKHDQRAFEIAAESLSMCYPFNTPYHLELFEILNEALRINSSRDKNDFRTLERRFNLLVQASWHGSKSPNEDYQKKASAYNREVNSVEDTLLLYIKLYKMLDKTETH